MFPRKEFLAGADLATKRAAYQTLLKMAKLLLTVCGHSLVHMVAEACRPDATTAIPNSLHNQVRKRREEEEKRTGLPGDDFFSGTNHNVTTESGFQKI